MGENFVTSWLGMLRFDLAYALIRASKIVGGQRQGLTESERYAVADHVVSQLKQHGDPWKLSEEASTTAAVISPTRLLG